MKKFYYCLLILIFSGFVVLTGVLLNQSAAERRLDSEVKKASAPLLEIRELIFERQRVSLPKDEARYKVLGSRIQEKFKEFEKTFLKEPKTDAQIIIFPKYVLLLKLAGFDEEAGSRFREGIPTVSRLSKPEVRVPLYINWGVCAIELEDSEQFEFCFSNAERQLTLSSDPRWREDVKKTLANIRILADEKKLFRGTASDEVGGSVVP